MSMFDKRKENEPAAAPSEDAAPQERRAPAQGPTSRGVAVIGKSITIKGDVTGSESLVIDGKVEGTLNLSGNDLTVGQTGHVKANVNANVVRVEGEITGDVSGVEKVVITKTGRVLGNIVAPRVTLEDGSKFKGSIDMDPGPAQKPASSPAPQPAAAGSNPLSVVNQAGQAADKG